MKVINSDCGVCEACLEICPLKLIKKEGYKIIIQEGCDNCGECVEVCPTGCIIPEED